MNYDRKNSDIKLLVATGMSERSCEAAIANLGSLAAVANATHAELIAAGVPNKTAAKLIAAFQIGRLSALRAGEAKPLAGRPADIYDLLRPLIGDKLQEHFYVVSIDVRNGILGATEVAIGNVAGVEVHPREVFRPAIRLAAAGIVLAHNHPSGDPTPSAEDIELTRRLREAGALIGIPVIDHVVVCATSFYSIAEMKDVGL